MVLCSKVLMYLKVLYTYMKEYSLCFDFFVLKYVTNKKINPFIAI